MAGAATPRHASPWARPDYESLLELLAEEGLLAERVAAVPAARAAEWEASQGAIEVEGREHNVHIFLVRAAAGVEVEG